MIHKRALAFALLVLVLASCNNKPDADTTYIILAHPKSGAQAALGREIERALAIIRDDLKAQNTVKIGIIEVDTESQPNVARAEVARALDRWRAPVVVGSILSAETREFLASTLARPAVVIANGSSDPGIRDLPFRRDRDGFFRNWPADDFEGRVMAEYLHDSGRARSLVVVHAADPYAAALATAFSDRFTQLGGRILGPEVYPTTITTFEAVLHRQPLTNHDGYYVVGFPRDLAGLYDTLRQTQETKDMFFYSAVGINTGEFTSLARSKLDRLFFTTPDVDESSGPYFEFRRKYSARFNGESPDIVAAVTYDALAIAVDAIRHGGRDPRTIAQYLYARPTYQGASGPTGFDKRGDVITKGVAINVYENGRRLKGESRIAELSK